MSIRSLFSAFLMLAALCSIQPIAAQDLSMKVTRCTGIGRDKPIQNIYVDADNTKWVGFGKGMYEVKALDLIGLPSLAPGEQSALAFVDGNADVRWTEAALNAQLDVPLSTYNYISAAWYEAAEDVLWLGTAESGLYRFNTKPTLKRIERMHTGNSKLKSNVIKNIFREKSGRFWISTEAGVLIGKTGAWRLETEFTDVLRIREYGGDIWILGDGDIWNGVNSKKWSRVDVPVKFLEGEMRDFDIDKDGNLWVVTEAVAKIDLVGGKSELYDQFKDFTSQEATCVATDRDGAVWVGTADKGVYLLEKNDAITVNFLMEKEISCLDFKPDAAIRVKITGGLTPYKYQWESPALSGDNPKNLAPGAYLLTVTDATGRTKTAKAVVVDPRMTVVALPKKAASTPEAADGLAELTVTGGKPDYAIKWDNGEKGLTAQKLTPGVHSITVTDAKGCNSITSVSISGKSLALAVTLTEKAALKCATDANGILLAEVTGGKAPYSYTWSNPALKGNNPNGLPSGEYGVTVADAEGTKASAIISLIAPKSLVLNAMVDAPASTGKSDGKATAQAKGGTGAFSYKWSNGETGPTATKLAPGPQSVTATDANGCQVATAFDVSENILKLNVVLSEKTKIKCPTDANGALETQVTGGKAPYTYAWNLPAAKGDAPNGLAAGDYSVTVTDVAGNKSSALISLSAPKPLGVTATVDAPASTGKSDGKATAKAKGGTGEFTYKWSTGETGPNVAKLAPGAQSVTATDANGCEVATTFEISENILKLNVTLEEKTAIRCPGRPDGALTVNVTGGKPPYAYIWDKPAIAKGEISTGLPAGDYAITVSDAAGNKATARATLSQPKEIVTTATVDAPASTGKSDGKATVRSTGGTGNFTFLWDNGEITATAVKLAPGKHTVTATEGNGCTSTATVEITENILAFSVVMDVKKTIKCAGETDGSLEVQVSGGKPPYKFAWNNPELKGEQVSGLSGGTYVVTVTDALGTSKTAEAKMPKPEALTAEVKRKSPASNEKTRDGKAFLQVKGGTGAYTYNWDNAETTAEAQKLPVGPHTCLVTDANGCSITVAVEIAQKILPELTAGLLRKGQTLRMEQLFFDADSTNFREESKPAINELYNFLEENPNIVVEIGGHTNSTPPDEFCDRLSTARAKAVADFIVKKGIDPRRIVHKGYGKRAPVASNLTPEGRKKNQRVEIKILKLGDE